MAQQNKTKAQQVKAQTKSRTFAIILYPQECSEHTELLENLKVDIGCKLVWAEHDKDTTDSGEPKKVHTHVVIRYDNPRSPNAVKKMLELYKVSHVEVIGDIEEYIRYLTHNTTKAKKEGKYQYSMDILQGNADLIARAYGTANTDTLKSLAHIIELLETFDRPSFAMLIQYVYNNEPELMSVINSNQHMVHWICQDISKEGVR